MANVLVSEHSLENIADAIRIKKGTNDTFRPSEMASEILTIETGTIEVTGGYSVEYDVLVVNAS